METFTCEICNNTYKKERPDEEAKAECKELWGDVKDEDQSIICHDCFVKFYAWASTEDLLKDKK